MKSKEQILQKKKLFYDEVRSKRKSKRMRLQVNNEFQQVKIKDLNDANNIDTFNSSIRGGKAFDAEQKIRELKTRIAKINAQKLKISPAKIIERTTLNMNLIKALNMVYLLRKLKDDLFLVNFSKIFLISIELKKLKSIIVDLMAMTPKNIRLSKKIEK